MTQSIADAQAPFLPVLTHNSSRHDTANVGTALATTNPSAAADSAVRRADIVTDIMSANQPPTTNCASSQASQTDLAGTPDPNRVEIQISTVEATQNGSRKGIKSDKSSSKQTNMADSVAEAGAGAKLSGAQLKAKKQAEKAARRAEKVAQKGEDAMPAQAPSSTSQPPPAHNTTNQSRRPSQSLNAPSAQPAHKRRTSNQALESGVVRIPIRPTAQVPSGTKASAQPTQLSKQIPFLSHLTTPANTKPATIASASREIHPAVITLALHLRSLTISGSTARTLSVLLVLKRVIQSYTTPPNTALSRHLTSHISHQLSFLASARPLGIAQGNAIRWLKKLISQLDPDLEESAAKKFLCDSIDAFIHERVTLASEVIASRAADRIAQEGEVILTYGKSSVVEKTLLYAAKEQKKKFKVVVIDSRPYFEGQNLARGLLRAGMCDGGALEGCKVIYSLTSGLSDILLQENVSLCLLGASGMLGNGRMQSRCGTALIASMIKQADIPVIALSHSLKFTARTALDNLTINELGNPDALVEQPKPKIYTTPTSTQDDPSSKKGGTGGKKSKPDNEGGDDSGAATQRSLAAGNLLDRWKETPNLYLLNLMYDYTPSDMVDAVICELGILPPGAVPVVNGVHGEEE